MDSNKGSILITTLWIIAILSLLAMGIGFRSSLEVRLSKYNMDRLKARYLAKAGIEKARERLLNDGHPNYDTLHECGIALKDEETTKSIFNVKFDELGNETFSVYYTYKKEDEEGKKTEDIQYGMIDEERKIDIKLTNLLKMKDYKNILKRLSPNFTDEIINAIKDWQDSDNAGEAENSYYETERGYSCKNGDFETIEELLLVKDVTGDLFNEVKDYITVYGGDEKININTAPEKVLGAVINNNELVGSIVNYRKAIETGGGWTNKDAFVRFLIDRHIDASLADYFTVKSSNFRIISRGNVRKITKTVTCVVEKEKKEIKYYHEE
ncbi:MAG: general secretion pathway protein GspK [Candidatus Omnitrophica bacterium]|nr:general secretion pathway protein GspK [Candidatus Omnitrophota bacterium]